MASYSRLLRLSALIATAAIGSTALAGCSVFAYQQQIRGNKIDADQMKELIPGVSTRNDVMAAVGSPTQRATFDDNTWLYISEVTRPRIGGTQAVEDQRVVVLTFDGKGVLSAIKTKNADDSVPVAMVDRTTPSPGSEASFLQQLLGNIGRFNPGGAATNSGTGPSGGAPKPF